MTPSENPVRNNFARAAEVYAQVAHFQKDSAREFAEYLRGKSDGKPFGDMLEAGCGTGFLTGYLPGMLAADAVLTVSDFAPEMLAFARKEAGDGGRVRFELLDFNRRPLPEWAGQYEIIVSAMALQWADSLSETLRELGRHLCAGGKLCFSLPLYGTFRRLREEFERENQPYPGLRLPSAEELRQILNQTGLTYRISLRNREETFSSMHEFLHHLQDIGTGNTTGNPADRGALRRIMKRGSNKQIVNYEYAFVTCSITKDFV